LEGLGINLTIIIAYAINFFVLFLALRAFAYKPVLAMLQRRRNEIAEGLAAADKVRAEAEQERQRLQSELEKARLSSQEEATKIPKATADMREGILEDARREAEQIKVKARQDVDAERDALQSEMRRQLADLTVQLTRRIVGETLSEQKQRDLIGQFLADMGDNK
jgi:F-type H+-transporting ATPase subunit b